MIWGAPQKRRTVCLRMVTMDYVREVHAVAAEHEPDGGSTTPPWPPPNEPPALPQGWRCALAQKVPADHEPGRSAPEAVSLVPYWYNVETLQVSWQPPIEWLRTSPSRGWPVLPLPGRHLGRP